MSVKQVIELEWFDVNDKLPNLSTHILCKLKDGKLISGYYIENGLVDLACGMCINIIREQCLWSYYS